MLSALILSRCKEIRRRKIEGKYKIELQFISNQLVPKKQPSKDYNVCKHVMVLAKSCLACVQPQTRHLFALAQLSPTVPTGSCSCLRICPEVPPLLFRCLEAALCTACMASWQDQAQEVASPPEKIGIKMDDCYLQPNKNLIFKKCVNFLFISLKIQKLLKRQYITYFIRDFLVKQPLLFYNQLFYTRDPYIFYNIY